MASYVEQEVFQAHRSRSPGRLDETYIHHKDSLESLHHQRRERSRDSQLPRSRSPQYRDELQPRDYRSPRPRQSMHHNNLQYPQGHGRPGDSPGTLMPRPRVQREGFQAGAPIPKYSYSDQHRNPHRDSARRHVRFSGSTMGGQSNRNISTRPMGGELIRSPSIRSTGGQLTRNPSTRSTGGESTRTIPRRRTGGDASDSEYDYSSSEERKRDSKAQKEKLLIGSLAAITTIAAANNIYQSTKAHEARREQVLEGELDEAEEKRLRRKHRLLDLFSVSVAAIGVNNARLGWKRLENHGR